MHIGAADRSGLDLDQDLTVIDLRDRRLTISSPGPALALMMERILPVMGHVLLDM